MRVLQLGPFPPPWGGVQSHVVDLRDYLRRCGDACMVANITSTARRSADEVFYPRGAADLLRLLFTLDYDVVHTHVGGALPRRVLALLLATTLVPGRRSVLTFHSGGFPSSREGRAARARSLAGAVLRRLDAVIGVNAELVALFRRLGVAADRAHHVEPYAFGPAIVGTARRGRAALPEPMQTFFAHHSPVLLSVGLLEQEYNVSTQIDALGRIRERYPDAGLVVIGSGTLRDELKAHIARVPWGAHVLLAGDVPRDQTLVAIAECDLLLRTTTYDGDSISVREALHLGTPVLATDNGMRPTGVRLMAAGGRNADALAVFAVDALAETRGAPRVVAANHEANLAKVRELYAALS